MKFIFRTSKIFVKKYDLIFLPNIQVHLNKLVYLFFVKYEPKSSQLKEPKT